MPRFSVVVPTRDRPDLLDFCLGALAAQTFDDFEVVVSDNPTRVPVEEVVERWSRPGWRYLRHEQQLPMHDNFERGCAQGAGGSSYAVSLPCSRCQAAGDVPTIRLNTRQK